MKCFPIFRILVFSAAVAFGAPGRPAAGDPPADSSKNEGKPGPAAPASPDVEKAIRAARDAVFKTIVRVDATWEDVSEGQLKRVSGQGSGTVIDGEGRILTNYHVAGKAREIRCTLHNKEIVAAQLVGGDPWTDLAVIRLDPHELAAKADALPHADLGDSDRLEIGDFVIAMGTPYGLSRTATFGRVSNTERFLGAEMTLDDGVETGLFNNWIQIDAPIYPGNSGGPLVNLEGKVVGVNARVQRSTDLGFAIPINVAKDAIAAILKDGRVRRGYLGLTFQKVLDLERFLGVAKNEGVLISAVEDGSPAAQAGVAKGDLLLQFGPKPVSARFDEEIPALNKLIADAPIGSTVELSILREGERRKIPVAIGELGKSIGSEREFKEWGLTVRGLTDRMAIRMGLREMNGVLVSGVARQGPAFRGGLQPEEDVVFEVAGEKVDNLEAFEKVFHRLLAEKKEKILIKVKRGVRGMGVNYAVIKAGGR